MNGMSNRNLVWLLISLAANVALIGIGLTCALMYWLVYSHVDITQHLWLIALPPAFSLLINVLLIEAYLKIARR
jgi:hypothetical protein